MEIALMKRLLVKSKQEAVHCAIGQDEDGVGQLLLNVNMSPAAIGRELQSQVPKLKNMRFGAALVDVDDNPKLVKITVNKAISGIARRLTKTLKGTGFNRVIILLDDGTVCDEHNDEELDHGTTAPPAPPIAPPTVQEPAADPLGARLHVLIDQMRPVLANAPGRKAELMAIAASIQAKLKTGDRTGAALEMNQLEATLLSASSPGGSAKTGTGTAFQKLRLLWDGTRKHYESQLKTLETAILEEAADDPQYSAISAGVTRVEASLQTLDIRLSDKLDEILNASDEESKQKLIIEARGIAAGYQRFVASDPFLQNLDGNPFVPLDARKRLDAALASILSHL